MPGAGKSSLLGALAQAAQLHENVLNGRLTELGDGLAALRQRLYEGTPRQTEEEVLALPVTYQSFAASSPGRIEAVLIDCDGRVVRELVNRRRDLGSRSSHGQLGEAIFQADAVVLAIDAAAGAVEVEADFGEFVRFLRLLKDRRGRRTDVGGLPVFLVLTKCDLLARPQDSVTAWMEQIEERKRQAARRFEEFLQRQSSALPFGSIDLHPWATAIKRPALADSPPRPQDPYGVAELFRQCFEQARGYRERWRGSRRRLLWTVAGSGSVLVVLAGLAAVLFATRPGQRVTLLDLQVERLQAMQQQQSPFARHRDVQAKIDELSRIEQDPVFPRLPLERRAFVEQRLKELHAYREFERKLTEVAAIDAAAQATRADYQKLAYDGKQVLDAADQPNLPRRARAVLDRADRVPDPRKDQDRHIPGSRRVTYRTVFGLAGVEAAYRQWERIRRELEPFALRAEKS
jgi:hypothetical protein